MWPAAHVQKLEPGGLTAPEGHGVHEPLPALLYVLAAHSVPASQSPHAASRPTQEVSAGA